jgi:alpha-galactosidase
VNGITLEHGALGIQVSEDMRLQFYSLERGRQLLAEGGARPAIVGSEMLCQPGTFEIEAAGSSDRADSVGGGNEKGAPVVFAASANFVVAAGPGIRWVIRQALRIEFYPQWPDSAVLYWQFENRGEQEVVFERLACPELQLDSDWIGRPGQAARPLWTLQGAAVHWGQDFAFPLPEHFQRDNDLGHKDGGEGGGIPLLDFWNERAGLSLAHVAPLQALWHLPVSASPDAVHIALEDRRPTRLAAGESLSSLPVLVTVHQGDFFAPLARYREVLAAQGIVPAEPNGEAYQPAWCSWGYEFDVRPQEMLAVLPSLEELSVRWLTLDDRWFDHYSDWNPRPDTFPGGGAQMREMVAQIHAAGGYAQLWWYPLAVEDGVGHWDTYEYGFSQILREHPEWLCLNADGSPARNNRGLAILCPALPEVQQHIQDQTLRFIQEWGFDGHKLDNIYTVPPCYNPAHHHRCPEDAVDAFPEVYRLIFATTRTLKPYSITQICPCGTPPTHTLLPFMDQAMTADPTSSAQVRQRIKFYKALLGPRAAVFADHVELSDGGCDFASAIGTGGIPSTKFVVAASPPEEAALRHRLAEWWGLDNEKWAIWKEWFHRYAELPLAQGRYLNLYDLAFDTPEGHAIRLGERLYYAFFAPGDEPLFQGQVELRGLGPGRYQVRDFLRQQVYGLFQGPVTDLKASFKHALLLEAIPVEETIGEETR